MSGKSLFKRIKLFPTALFFIPILFILFTGCGGSKLVDQSNQQLGAIVESMQANFAEEGWTYTGFEVLEKDKENDTAIVAITYDVEGDAKDLLEKNLSEKPVKEEAYSLAEDINVKRTVEISAYDKENDAMGCNVLDTTWFIGDMEANAWFAEQNSRGACGQNQFPAGSDHRG